MSDKPNFPKDYQSNIYIISLLEDVQFCQYLQIYKLNKLPINICAFKTYNKFKKDILLKNLPGIFIFCLICMLNCLIIGYYIGIPIFIIGSFMILKQLTSLTKASIYTIAKTRYNLAKELYYDKYVKLYYLKKRNDVDVSQNYTRKDNYTNKMIDRVRKKFTNYVWYHNGDLYFEEARVKWLKARN